MLGLGLSLWSSTILGRGALEWLLETGVWNDLGYWVDTETWNDGA